MIGFDNLQFARACNPKLTIVAQPTQGIAGEVAGIMLKRLEGAASEETEPISGEAWRRDRRWENPSVCWTRRRIYNETIFIRY